MKHELKIVKAPCNCPKCQSANAPELNVLGRLKALATLAMTAKHKPTPTPKRTETDAEVAVRLQAVARQRLAEMGVPPPPDLNAAIREHRAKESK